MRLLEFSSAACLAGFFALANAQWSFSDAKVSIQGKGAGSTQESLSPSFALSTPITLGPADTLKITLTATEDNNGKRPHQAFLVLKETLTGLTESFPLATRETGKGKVDLTQKDLPIQLLTSSQPLKASLVIGSFGSSSPLNAQAFDLIVKPDPGRPISIPEKPERYGKLEEIHHIFRSDPKSPPFIITLVFLAAALLTLPALLIGWLSLGANLNQLPQAFGDAPISHGLFFGSIIAMEGIFALYYSHWTLFRMLPAAGVVGTVAFFSGSRALSEVQARRLAWKR